MFLNVLAQRYAMDVQFSRNGAFGEASLYAIANNVVLSRKFDM